MSTGQETLMTLHQQSYDNFRYGVAPIQLFQQQISQSSRNFFIFSNDPTRPEKAHSDRHILDLQG